MPPRPLVTRLFAMPVFTAWLFISAVTALPLAAGMRYQGRDHTLIQLGLACAHRDTSRLVLDPTLGGGSPLLEEPVGQVFYPFTWLLRPFSAELATSLYVVLHLGLAAAAAAYLARVMGSTRRASLATGLAFALTGTVIDLVLHGPFLCAAAWLPLGWAGARELSRRPSAKGVLALAASLALLVTGGEPQSAMVLVAITLVEAIAAVVTARRRGTFSPWTRRSLPLLFAAGLAGTLLGAVQVLASAGLRTVSARALAATSDPYQWALEGAGWLGLVWPLSLTREAHQGASLLATVTHTPMSSDLWNASPYVGLVALSAALAGALSGTRRTAAGVGFGALVVSAGKAGLALPALAAVLPFLARFRYPEKYLTAASLGLVIVAVSACEVASKSARVRARLGAILAGATVLSLVGTAMVIARRAEIDAAALRVAVRAPSTDDLGALSSMVLTAGLTASLTVALAALALRSVKARRYVAALLIADLALAAWGALSMGPPVLTAEHPRIAAMASTAHPAICHGIGFSTRPFFVPDRLVGIERDTALAWADLRPDIHQCSPVASPQTYLPSAQYGTLLLTGALLDLTRPSGVEVARALGCTHVTVPGAADPSLRPVAVPQPPTLAGLYEVPDPLPEVAVARSPAMVVKLREVIRALLPGRSAADALRVIDDPIRRTPTPLPAGDGVEGVRADWHGATAVTISLRGRGGAVVALRRPFWPGWTATQQNRPLRVVRVAGVQLGVVVDDVARGPVEMTYRVVGLRAGVGLSALGALVLAATLAWVRRKR